MEAAILGTYRIPDNHLHRFYLWHPVFIPRSLPYRLHGIPWHQIYPRNITISWPHHRRLDRMCHRNCI